MCFCLSHDEDPYILCICIYIYIHIALLHDSLIDMMHRQDCAQVRVAPKGRQHPDVRLKLAMFETNGFWLKAWRFGGQNVLSYTFGHGRDPAPTAVNAPLSLACVCH